jgi:hypothetical protein
MEAMGFLCVSVASREKYEEPGNNAECVRACVTVCKVASIESKETMMEGRGGEAEWVNRVLPLNVGDLWGRSSGGLASSRWSRMRNTFVSRGTMRGGNMIS